MKFGFTFDFMCVYRLSLNCMNYISIVMFTLLAGGGMAATNCGLILTKCSFTMHIRFCMRTLTGANAKPS